MAITRKTTKELTLVKNLQMLTVVYEEIAVMRINTTKSSVLITREFLEKLLQLFHDIKVSYKNQLVAALEGKKTIDPLLLAGEKKNGKEVHVLLSANNKMYGDILTQVYASFIAKTDPLQNADIVIIGEIGKSMYEQHANKKQFTYFPISDTEYNVEQIRPILYALREYEKVCIYYGKFMSVLQQEPTVTDISGNQLMETEHIHEQDAQEPQERFLFEPNLPHIVSVFESQIFYALFKQSLHEIELARYASRIKAMEKTSENITIRVKKLLRQEKQIKQLQQNKRQLQELANIMYYKRKTHNYAKG